MSVTAESFDNTSYLLGGDCSPEAILVREALVAKGLATPMIGKSLSREEKIPILYQGSTTNTMRKRKIGKDYGTSSWCRSCERT